MTDQRDYIQIAHDAQPGLSERDSGSFVTLHRQEVVSEAERAWRLHVALVRWWNTEEAFNTCWRAAGRMAL